MPVTCRAGLDSITIQDVSPFDVRQHYASHRLSFSLRTKSNAGALRAAQSFTQRLEDYWLGLCLQRMDITSISLRQIIKSGLGQHSVIIPPTNEVLYGF